MDNSTERGLREVQERLPWAVQKRNRRGLWRTVEECRGRTQALDRLNRLKEEEGPRSRFRALPKNEADKYLEGINALRESVRPRKVSSTRIPSLARDWA